MYVLIYETIESNWVSGEMYDLEKTLCKVRDNTKRKELESNLNALKVQLEVKLKESSVSVFSKIEDCGLVRLYPIALVDCDILPDLCVLNDMISMLVWTIYCIGLLAFLWWRYCYVSNKGRFVANPE